MSYRISQLSPHSTNIRVKVHNANGSVPENFGDMTFLRSWLEFDSEAGEKRSRSGLNWNAILGFAVMLGIGAGFWTGVGLLIARLVG